MSKFKMRVLSGVVGAVLVLLLVFASPLVFHVAVGLACLVALYELYRTFDQTKKWQIVIPGYVFALIFLVLPALPAEQPRALSVFLLVAYLMILSISSVLFHETIKFSDVSGSLFSLIYGVLLLEHLSYIRMLDQGVALVILAFLGAWMPDTFAYFAGMLFGKHKLIPKVSPKKTVEGSVGGVFGAVVSFFIWGLIMQFSFDYSVNYIALLVLSLICGVVSQFGDLSASVIKRECGKKDFGNLIPGHGGILDRFDSLIFIAPLLYYFIQIFEVICK